MKILVNLSLYILHFGSEALKAMHELPFELFYMKNEQIKTFL
jgi:hypothetical protein